MVRVALIYSKDKYILREYLEGDELKDRDSTMEYGEFTFLEDAIDNLAQTYPDGREFIFKIVGFEGESK